MVKLSSPFGPSFLTGAMGLSCGIPGNDDVAVVARYHLCSGPRSLALM
jgi:hypothetical protein